MARKVTPAQFRSMMQQQQRKRKQAIEKYNREVRQYNQAVKRDVAKVNREIATHNQKAKRDINRYNSEVRAHNSRVRANRSRLQTELRRLKARTNSSSYINLQTSVRTVVSTYQAVEQREASGHFREIDNDILEYAERETANSVGVMNALLDSGEREVESNNEIDEGVLSYLASVSSEIVDRWRGALFSLNPNNPDAARHFCTSAREVLTHILDVGAPNQIVKASIENVDLTPNGTPTRRAKIMYMLHKCGVSDEALTEFILADISDVVDLFQVFNAGTHGSAGKFTLHQLSALKARVEGAFGFLARLSS